MGRFELKSARKSGGVTKRTRRAWKTPAQVTPEEKSIRRT